MSAHERLARGLWVLLMVEPVPVRVDQFGAPGGEHVWLQGGTVSARGELYVYGDSVHQPGDRIWVRGFVRKSSGAGVELWVDEFGEPGSARVYAGAAADDGRLDVVGNDGPGRRTRAGQRGVRTRLLVGG